MADSAQSPSVETQLAVINTKLDTIIASADATRIDHEIRLRKVEQFRWILLGAALASGPAFSAIAAQINS